FIQRTTDVRTRHLQVLDQTAVIELDRARAGDRGRGLTAAHQTGKLGGQLGLIGVPVKRADHAVADVRVARLQSRLPVSFQTADAVDVVRDLNHRATGLLDLDFRVLRLPARRALALPFAAEIRALVAVGN